MTDFGRETSCLDTLRTGRFVTGPRLVAEAAYRRLITPPGTLRGGDEEADYGLDLAGMIGTSEADNAAAAMPSKISAELRKDERILDVSVSIVSTKQGPSISWDITIEGETGDGPFTLLLGVSEVTVTLLGITAGN